MNVNEMKAKAIDFWNRNKKKILIGAGVLGGTALVCYLKGRHDATFESGKGAVEMVKKLYNVSEEELINLGYPCGPMNLAKAVVDLNPDVGEAFLIGCDGNGELVTSIGIDCNDLDFVNMSMAVMGGD